MSYGPGTRDYLNRHSDRPASSSATVAAVGSFLLILMACTTLSFLATTPEAWDPLLGDATHGFPFLSGVGRLIIKDTIMLGAAVVTLADSARTYLRRPKASVL